MNWRIVTDTGSNFRQLEHLPENISFELVPLFLRVDDKEFIDNPDLNIEELIESVRQSSQSGSACPAPGVYAEKFKGVDNVICFTLSSEVSGSYASAEAGKEIALEENPDANIYIFDTKSAGGEIDLLILKAIQLIKENKKFEEVIADLDDYHENTHAGYMLKSIDNLVKNGRVNKVIGSLVGLLNIHIIGVRSDEGTIEMSNRARGERRALRTFLNDIVKGGFNGRVLELSHVNNKELADKFSEMVKDKFPNVDIRVRPTSGLCAFYAEDGGLIVGYEKD